MASPAPGRGGSRVFRAALVALAAAALAACQSVGMRLPAIGAEPAWRVVERTGEARFRRPADGGWAPVMADGEIAGASRVATGRGGRLILASSGVQIAAGTASAFVLAHPSERSVRQEAGRLRYRIDRAGSAPFAVETPFMRINTSQAVFDVTVGPEGGEVSVEEGRLLVATPDGARGATLDAGQTAYAGALEGARLMVRPGVSGPAPPAGSSAVAVEPQRARAAVHAVARAALAREAAPVSDPTPRPAPPKPAILPAGYGEQAAPDAPRGGPAPIGAGTVEPATVVIDQRQEGFERLTADLLESLPAATPHIDLATAPESESP